MKVDIGMCDKLTSIKNEDFTKEQEYMKEKAIEKQERHIESGQRWCKE